MTHLTYEQVTAETILGQNVVYSYAYCRIMYFLKEFTEGAVTNGVESLFKNLTTRVEKDNFLRRCQLGSSRTLKG